MTAIRGIPAVEPEFDPRRCDLCGSEQASIVLNVADRSLTSDLRVVARGMRKLRCRQCGLVRSGDVLNRAELQRHYRDDYGLSVLAAAAEPLFFQPDRTRPRSEVFFDWISSSLERAGAGPSTSILEIGAGEGSLLARFSEAFPDAAVAGMDLSPTAVAEASTRHLSVAQGSYRDAVGSYDLIYAVAVMEHVPSPHDFVASLGPRLSDTGVLVVCQPSQDCDSNDIFFRDHLWHFTAAHVSGLASGAGLSERYHEIGTELIPDFSLHVLAKGTTRPRPEPGPLVVGADRVDASVARWSAAFRETDSWLKEVRKPIAVWGLGQTFSMILAYTGLRPEHVSAGVDENLTRFKQAGFAFPLIRPDELSGCHPTPAVLVTFQPSNSVREQLMTAGLEYHCAVPAPP